MSNLGDQHPEETNIRSDLAAMRPDLIGSEVSSAPSLTAT
jgi:hypothetical protein